MHKQEFLAELRRGLAGLPQSDMQERLTFYAEMIDDRVEEGLTQEQAVAELGPVESIVAQIMSEFSPTGSVKEKPKPGRALRVWEIVLLVLGAPIWLSLLIALAAVLLAVYVVFWSVLLSLWAIGASVAACAAAGIICSVVFWTRGNGPAGIMMLGAGLLCAGLAVFALWGCKCATKGVLRGTGQLFRWQKARLKKKEAMQ